MSALKSAKHEAFCRAIVEGKPGREAYAAAGYKATPAAAETNASRLLRNALVSARIAELKGAAADKTVMDLREVLQELTKLGRSDIRNCVVGGDDTADVIASIHDLNPEHSACIQELTVETYVEGSGDDARDVKRVKVKLHDKRGALNELRRHHEPNRHELSGPGGGPIETEIKEATPPSDIELARRIAFALEKGARAIAAGTIAGQAPTPDKPAAKAAKKKRKARTPKAAIENAAPTAPPKGTDA